MKIVKMHEGNREAFDDFLEQRLNDLLIDNDLANKYFANMNLPVPVIPEPAASALLQHKNKLWFLVLLLGVGFIAYLVYTNSSYGKHEIVQNKDVQSGIKNNIEKIGSDNLNVNNTNEISKGEKQLDKNNITDVNIIFEANKINAFQNNVTTYLNTTKDNLHKNSKITYEEISSLKQKEKLHFSTTPDINSNKNIDSFKLNTNNFSSNNTPIKLMNSLQKSNTKTAVKVDSLYIIW